MIRNASAQLRANQSQPGPDQLLNELAVAFHSAPQNNIVHIPENAGEGIIRSIPIAEESSVIFIDLQVVHSLELKTISLNPAPGKVFTILCSLSPGHLQFRKKKELPPLPGILFTSLDNELDLIISSGQKIKAVILHFSAEWLKEECRDAGPDLLFMVHDLIRQENPLLFMEQPSFSLHQMLSDMHHYAFQDQLDPLPIKAKTISVLHDILRRLQAFASGRNKDGNTPVHRQMTEIEKIVQEHLYSSLPSISAIAKQLALSESTLKRNFKQVYGIGLYEYYLQQKMQLARELLAGKPVTVNEVAHRLGYEKTSNFIKIFRKYYDFSPGSLKKKYTTD